MTNKIEDYYNKLNIIHTEAINEWYPVKKGTIQIATGLGKSFISCRAICKMPIKSKILILYENVDRKENFLIEIKKYENINNINILSNYEIDFGTYQKYYKLKDLEYTLLIADEIHDSLSPAYSRLYFNNSFEYIIGLSAYVDKTVEYVNTTKGKLLNRISPIIYNLGLKEAREKGLIRDINLQFIEGELSKKKTHKVQNKKVSFYTSEYDNYNYWKKSLVRGMILKETDGGYLYYRAIHNICKILYFAEWKQKIVNELLKKHQNEKTIVYANNLDFLNSITDNVVSSKKSNEENERIISDFNNGKINIIASFKKLEQGINLADLDNVIIASYYSKDKSMIQRLGRLRFSYKKGNVYILKTNNTLEEKWLEKIKIF